MCNISISKNMNAFVQIEFIKIINIAATIVIVTIMLAIVLVILGLLIAIHLTDTCIGK